MPQERAPAMLNGGVSVGAYHKCAAVCVAELDDHISVACFEFK